MNSPIMQSNVSKRKTAAKSDSLKFVGNVILTEGLVLQDEKIWNRFLEKDIIRESNSCELYFEEQNIEAFAQKLERLYPSIQYVNGLMTHSWGQKIIRFYDLDGHLIEVGTPM